MTGPMSFQATLRTSLQNTSESGFTVHRDCLFTTREKCANRRCGVCGSPRRVLIHALFSHSAVVVGKCASHWSTRPIPGALLQLCSLRGRRGKEGECMLQKHQKTDGISVKMRQASLVSGAVDAFA